MRQAFVSLLAVLSLAMVFPGNKADVNSDQAVNIADSVVLANIVAGNIPLSNYDLANVVVVAPQGGDFTDPADAADWVAAQNPAQTKQFVILITPGYYTITRQLVLPRYTTLQGYGKVSVITAAISSTDESLAATVKCWDGMASIRDLCVYNNGSADNTMAIAIYGQQYIDIRNCTVWVSHSGASGVPIGVAGSRITIRDSDITIPGNSAIGLRAGGEFTVYDTQVKADICIHGSIEIYNSRLDGVSGAATYYIQAHDSNSYARMYSCKLTGTSDGTFHELIKVYCFIWSGPAS